MAALPPQWQVPILKALALEAQKRGFTSFNKSEFWVLLVDLAELEKKLPEEDRVGYSKITAYSPPHVTRFLMRVKPLYEELLDQGKFSEKKSPREPMFIETVNIFRVKLDKSDYTEELIGPIFQRYFTEHTKKKSKVTKLVNIGDFWYDMEVVHCAGLQDLCDLLSALPWCFSVETIPESEFGTSRFEINTDFEIPTFFCLT